MIPNGVCYKDYKQLSILEVDIRPFFATQTNIIASRVHVVLRIYHVMNTFVTNKMGQLLLVISKRKQRVYFDLNYYRLKPMNISKFL